MNLWTASADAVRLGATNRKPLQLTENRHTPYAKSDPGPPNVKQCPRQREHQFYVRQTAKRAQVNREAGTVGGNREAGAGDPRSGSRSDNVTEWTTSPSSITSVTSGPVQGSMLHNLE